MNGEGIEMNLNRSRSRAIIDKRYKDFKGLIGTVAENHNLPSAWFNRKNGGYYIMQKGHNYYDVEIEAARILAENGFAVRLQPENEEDGGISLRLSKSDDKTFPEGTIGTLWYEQKTNEVGGGTSIEKAFRHFNDKGAEVGVIYDRGNKLSAKDIQKGIDWYLRQYKQDGFVKHVIVVSNKRRLVYSWKIKKPQQTL